MPRVYEEYLDDALIARYNRLFTVRDEVLRKLELLRANKVIGSSLEAQVKICSDDTEMLDFLRSFEGKEGADLETLFIVSKVELVNRLPDGHKGAPGLERLSVEASRIGYPKCQRCWNYRESVGRNERHLSICDRCVGVVEGLRAGRA
jgi:isoleucyl-tRNA synthetase